MPSGDTREDDHGDRHREWFNPTKRFGFVQPDAGGGDIFDHISAVQRSGQNDPPDGSDVVADTRTGRMSAGQIEAM